MNRARLLRYGMDQLSTWLPALLMMLFALGTWWLVRNAPKFPDAAQQALVSPEPDYFMRQFSVRSFDADGRLKSELTGAEGHHFPVSDTLEVTQPRMRSYDQQARPTLATARRAVSNGDGSEVRLYGDARVVREAMPRADGGITPRMEFHGEFLHAFVDEERVSSDQPVELRRGSSRFTGNQFDYDHKSGVAQLKGQVRGVIEPRAQTR